MKPARLLSAIPCLALVSSFAAGCGGSEKKPMSPDSVTGAETTGKEDMPAPKEGDPPAEAAGDKAAGGAPAGGPSGGVIKIAEMTITPAKAGGSVKAVALKADGTITVDGKPAAKIKGDEVDTVQGTSMVTVGLDGSLVGNGVKPGFRFEGDDLAGENGLRVNVGDDGTLTAAKDGKSEVLGKADGAASAKRAALILAVLYLDVPATPGADPAKADKGKKAPKGTKKKK